MKKFVTIAVVSALAFLSGCATNGYVAEQPQMVQQPIVVQQQPTPKQGWPFNGATPYSDGKGNCKIIFADKTEAVFKNVSCAALMAKYNGGENGEEDVKVIYVNQPAQQPVAQQVVATGASSTLSSDPLIRGGIGTAIGAGLGWVVNAIAGGNRDNRKAAVFGGAVGGAVVGVSTTPSSGYGGQYVAPSYSGGYFPTPYYNNGYSSPYYGASSADYLRDAQALQYLRQAESMSFNSCFKRYGYAKDAYGRPICS